MDDRTCKGGVRPDEIGGGVILLPETPIEGGVIRGREFARRTTSSKGRSGVLSHLVPGPPPDRGTIVLSNPRDRWDRVRGNFSRSGGDPKSERVGVQEVTQDRTPL